MLLEQIIKLIVAILAVGIIFYAGVVLFQTYFGNREKLQAGETINSLAEKLNDLEMGITLSNNIIAPSGWYIVSFDDSHNENGDFNRPQMIQPNIVCICKDKCETSFCRAIDFPLKQEDNLVNFQISIMEIWLTQEEDYYKLDFENPNPKPEHSEE